MPMIEQSIHKEFQREVIAGFLKKLKKMADDSEVDVESEEDVEDEVDDLFMYSNLIFLQFDRIIEYEIS